MSGKAKNTWGGARPGAGAPKVHRKYSEAIKKDVDKHVKLLAKETGKTFGRVLCELAWKEDLPAQFRSPFLKLIADIQCVKESHVSGEIKHNTGPQIYLPEPMAKPEEAIERERKGLEIVR